MPAKELNKVACLLIKGGEICCGPAKKSGLIKKGWPLRATPTKRLVMQVMTVMTKASHGRFPKCRRRT